MAKQETKSRFNIFDALLILLILACIAALVFRYYYNSKDAVGEQVKVSFIVPAIMPSTADAMTEKLRTGTVLYLSDGDSVRLKALTDRPLTFDQMIVRVSPTFRTFAHLDYDEANACGFQKGDLGMIV